MSPGDKTRPCQQESPDDSSAAGSVLSGVVTVAGEYGAFSDGTECPVGRTSASTRTCWLGRSEAGRESVASFTALGARRGSNWQGTPTPAELAAIAATTRDGFTGHDMLDAVGLVHMGGRVYDPVIGRFLSVDPIVRDPGASQSWNGYGYVEGRALSWTDPSGFEACPGGNKSSAKCRTVPVNPTTSNIPPPPAVPAFVPTAATVTAQWIPLEGMPAGGFISFWGGIGTGRMALGDGTGAFLSSTVTSPTGTRVCEPVEARVLEGNPATVGRPGGFSGRTVGDIRVRSNSAAVDPAQWGGKSQVRRIRDQVSGTTAGGQSFDGITDVIGSTDVANVREVLTARYPGALLIELVTGEDEGVTLVQITVPAGTPCPGSGSAYDDYR